MSCGMYGVGCSRDHRDYEDQVPRHTHLGRKEKGYGSLEARRKESFLFRVQRDLKLTHKSAIPKYKK